MSHKVHPLAFRLGVHATWKSRWFDAKNYVGKLREDIASREFLTKKLRSSGLQNLEIERTQNKLLIVIHTSRPGLIIGRAGTGIETLQKEVQKVLESARRGKSGAMSEFKIEVREVRSPETFASLVGLSIAEQLERRMPFRRVLKQAIERTSANKQVQGVKILVSGRLGGAEMSREEWLKEGRLPRNTLRSDIDFAQEIAYTTYGTIGIKVWIYKGQKLE
ncbi:MAG: 30S ribosomal protein S3 [Candidatus Spechtbacteria bacterium]|nr:30S ribosomal protein S3 [Candidatus Spechtbacteria bacterium]